MKRKNNFYLLLSVPALIMTLVIFVFPLLSVLFKSLSSLEKLGEVFSSRYTYRLLGFTALESAVSSILSTALALPFAIFFSRYDFRGKRFVLALSDTAFVMPSIIVVLGFVIWYGKNGILNNALSSLSGGRLSINVLYSFKAIILAHIYLNFPLAFSYLTGALLSSGDIQEKAALSLGKKRWKVTLSILLPSIKSNIYQILLLIFLFCYPSFLIVMTLGGNPKYYTIEAEIYRRTYMDGDLASSSSLALFSLLVLSILLLITSSGRKEKKVEKKKRELKKAEGGKKVKAFILSFLIALFILPPILSILYRSLFTRDGVFTLMEWKKILSSDTVKESLLSSLSIAFLSSAAATRMAGDLALSEVRRKSIITPLLSSLPMALGSVTLGLGFSFLSSKIGHGGKISGLIFTLLAHITVVLPFAFRTILPRAEKISERLYYSALSLSSSNMECYRKVERPLLRRSMLTSFAFSFALSMGETNATMTLSGGKITTLPVLIYKMIQQYNYQGASCLSVIVIVLSLLVFAISEKGGDRNVLS